MLYGSYFGASVPVFDVALFCLLAGHRLSSLHKHALVCGLAQETGSYIGTGRYIPSVVVVALFRLINMPEEYHHHILSSSLRRIHVVFGGVRYCTNEVIALCMRYLEHEF